MSFDPPPTSAEQTSKRPHLSIFNFSSFRQTASVEPPPYSPNDVFAERNQRLAGILHWARVILSVITLIAGAIVIGCAASSLRSYSSTHLNSQYFLPLWPTSVDLRPTHAMLACGVTISSFSLVYLISVFVPTPGPKLHLLNTIWTPFSFLSLFITVFTTVFASTITSHLADSTDAGSLTSWTCKWSSYEDIAPMDFVKICTQSTVASDLVIFLIIVEVLAVGISGWGWWIEARVKKEGNEKGTERV
ncbi:MAG: hypothetical protein HETSPECPRED_006939 [Heterodermia speciosa]|uniref:MARVEL domain-containing protein n=1 Tax=Heterodermia speciosa TaxID=116794 RepID=A0A8H3FT23_9LECA|nr:MAG: hypothetical protein HETSPECPRED_006939 [Heterodermia speciosa]